MQEKYGKSNCRFGLNCRKNNCRFNHPTSDAHQQYLRDMMMNSTKQQQTYSVQGEDHFNQQNTNFQIKQNQQHLVERSYGGCRRGRGRHMRHYHFQERKNYQQHDRFNQHWEEKHVKRFRKTAEKNGSDQSQSESENQNSSEDQDTFQNHKQVKNKEERHCFRKRNQKCKNNKKKINPESYQQFSIALFEFFQIRKIKPVKRIKILQYLARNWQSAAVAEIIIPLVQQLQSQGYINHFCYKNVIKIICKQNFMEDKIKQKLSKKMQVDNKRSKKDKLFNELFPNPVQIDFLESQDLLFNQIQSKNSIYLIDGNNCLVTQKNFRKYFQNQTPQMKAQAQLRLQWLISLAIQPKRCYLFFDDQFQPQIYSDIKNQILYPTEAQHISKIHVQFAQQNQEADQLILNKFKKLKQTMKEEQLCNIVLVTADRVLTHKAYEINHLRKSSGMYLFKFCKKMIKQKYHNDPLKKGILKRIFMDRFNAKY